MAHPMDGSTGRYIDVPRACSSRDGLGLVIVTFDDSLRMSFLSLCVLQQDAAVCLTASGTYRLGSPASAGIRAITMPPGDSGKSVARPTLVKRAIPALTTSQ